MDEKNQEYSQQNNPDIPEADLDLDAIMKEFSPEEVEIPQEDEPENQEPSVSMEETRRIELPAVKEKASKKGDTIRLDNVVKAVKEQLPEEPEQPVALDEPEEIRIAQPNIPKKEEP